jgi:hypothetical protein
MTDDQSKEILARFTLHEFLLEVWYANWLADMSEQDAEAFARDFENRMHSPRAMWDAGNIPVSSDYPVSQHSIELARRFLNKVRSRSRELRTKRSQAQLNQ